MRYWLVVLLASNVFAQPSGPLSSPRLVYSTYVGPGRTSAVLGIAVDSGGHVYAGGLGGGPGSGCAFLTKLNPGGTAALWSVCLPLTQVQAVALDAAGFVYVLGQSSGATNPATVLKLTQDGQPTSYSAQVEGGGTALALDRAGNVYIAGASRGGFVAKFSASGSLVYNAQLDLVGYPGPKAIAVDSKGRAWIAGNTCACPGGGGECGSANLTCLYGTASAVRELDANGAKLLVSKTYGGGATADHGFPYQDSALGVAVDASDSPWVVGTAEDGLVPTTPGALEGQRDPSHVGFGNGLGYALKLSSSGDLLYGTYLGTSPGGGDQTIASVTLDSQGRPYFALNQPYPKFNGFGCSNEGATIMGLSADGSTVLLSGHLLSFVQAIALDGRDGLYAGGTTQTLGFLTTPGAYQPLYPGGFNSGHAAKFDLSRLAPQMYCVVNAASLVRGNNEGAVTPGEIVTVIGQGLPPNPKVSLDGRAAPILYSDANQINAVVPFAVSAPSTVVLVEGAGGFTLPVFPAVPALFTTNSTGSGQVAALNQDGSVNSGANPAAPGSIVALYMTGLGAMTPPIGDGQLGPLQPPFPVPVLGVGATVNGVVATVLFAGQAPGLIAGAVQVNVRIPPGTTSGNVGLIVYVDNYRSQVGPTTIAVQ